MQPALLQDVDGELWATQARWKASFEDSGVIFSPMLGPEAPTSLPVRFEFVGAHRGLAPQAASSMATPPAAPEVRDRTVVYGHGEGIREVYEIRDEGLKHSVVFDARPTGSGDLRVRMALDSQLTASPGRYPGSLVLGDGDRGIVEIGAVLGFDAAGRQQSGWLEYADGHVDLVLPAGFVDSAIYPLTVDPLIGSLTTVANGNVAVDPDVAYDVTQDVYLVVWQEFVSSQNRDVWGQRIRQDGSLVGSRIAIDTNGNDDYAPRVASVNLRDAFYVVWEFDNHYSGSTASKEIWGRAVRASDGSMGSKLRIQDAIRPVVTIFEEEGLQPDVCGERTTADDEVLVVYVQPRSLTTSGLKGILSKEVTVAADLSSSVVSSRTKSVRDNVDARRPRICNSGGNGRTAVVVWEDSPVYIGARAISMNSSFRSAVGLIAGTSTASLPVSQPVVDGDGTTFLIAYRREEPTNSRSNDIWTIDFQLPSSASALWSFTRQAPFEADRNQSENLPSIALMQDGTDRRRQFYAIHYKQGDPNVREDSWIGRVNGFGESCGPRDLVKNFSSSSNITSTYAGGRNGDDRGIAVIYNGSSIQAHGYEAFGNGGPIVDRGGRCGLGGTLTANGPLALGNRDFSLELRGANNGRSTSTIITLSLSASPSVFRCGAGCTVVLDPAASIGLSAPSGNASFSLPVVCGASAIGLPINAQFLTLTPSVNPCGLATISVSNWLQTSIGR